MEPHFFDCRCQGFGLLDSESYYVKYTLHDYNSLFESALMEDEKIIYEESSVTPMFPVTIPCQFGGKNRNFIPLALMILDEFAEDGEAEEFYLCAELSTETNICDTFWISTNAINYPVGRVFNIAATASLYSALGLMKQDFDKWLQDNIKKAGKNYKLWFTL